MSRNGIGPRWPGGASWGIFGRVVSAVFGGYVAANAVAIIIARLLSLSRAEAVMTALLISYALFAVVVLWVFAVKSAMKACLGLWCAAILLGLGAWSLPWSAAAP